MKSAMGQWFILPKNMLGHVTLPMEVMEHCGLPFGGKLLSSGFKCDI
jgi:hypothetical protein